MKKYIHSIAFFMLTTQLSFSQVWTSIATFNQVIDDLKSYHGNLFIGGNFYQRDGHTTYSSCYYTGSSFVDQSALIGGTGFNRFEIYKDTLWGTGGIDLGFGVGLAWWDGSQWAGGGNFSSSQTGIYADGNDLWVGSDFSVVNRSINGAAFTPLPAFDGSNTSIYAINKYGGQIIVAGTSMSYSGTNLYNIAKWTGSTWQGLGTGLDGTVRCLAVYNGELYAGGYFTHAGGTAAQYIAKWNGTTWSAVGGSVNTAGGNGLRDMVVYNNKLYVVGDFTQIGGVSAKNVAVWNGTTWNNLNFNGTGAFANAIEAYNGKIYVGMFSFTAANLYVSDLATDVETHKTQNEFSIFPNPVSGILNVSYKDHAINGAATILTINGKILLKKELSENTVFDVSVLPTGTYLLVVRDKDGNILSTKKFIRD